MICSELNEHVLNDFVDGLLEEKQHEDVEGHLASCTACKAEHEGLLRLLAAARALPGGHSPSRDLLPEIREAATGKFPRSWAAVAAALLLAGGLAFGPRLLGPPGAASEFRAAERHYSEASAESLDALNDGQSNLPSETIAVLEANLEILDRAIQQARQAMQAEPTNPRGGHALTALHRQKLNLLWKASRLSS